jgi:AcrR family transcriptional regulator
MSDGSPRRNQRERILDTALELMSRRGSAGVSMRQLAAACGVQVAALYHYFPSKDALLSAVIEERRYSARLADLAPLDVDAPVEERLRRVFELFWEGALEEEPVLRLLLGEALRSEPVALPTGSALLDVFRSGVVMALEQVVPEVRDAKAVSELYMAQVFSAFLRHVFEPEVPTSAIGDDQAEVLVRVVLGSLS